MKNLLPFALGLSLFFTLLLLTLQYFLSPLYLELEYEHAGFPPPRAISADERYIAAQALLSYLNVEVGGASLLSLGELQFGGRPFFNDSDLACIFRAKEVRGYAFGWTFVTGAAFIAIGLFLAAGDFTRARRLVMFSALISFLIYTLLSLWAQLAFDGLAAFLLSLVTSNTCAPAAVNGLPQIFPPQIFRDGLVLLALGARLLALGVVSIAWLFGWITRRLTAVR